VAVSPFNAKIQVAVAHDCRFASGGAVAISYAWTSDGGAHWQHAPVPGLTKAVGGTYDRASDPVVAFGADGSVYISALVIDVNNCDSGVAVSRSTDGGATFGKPVYAQQSTSCGVSDDKNWLVTDTQPNSFCYGRIYQFWTEFLANGGKTWTRAVQVTHGNAPDIQYINAAVTAANGRVFVAFGRRNLNSPNIIQQELTWSSDGGKTFAPPIALGPPSNLKYAAVAGGKFPGDYTGLSATPARVTGAWVVSSKPSNPTAAFRQVLYAATLRP
jgi:hypothetical protein